MITDLAPKFPKEMSRVGSAVVQWQEVSPSKALVHAHSGTPEDKVYAEKLIEQRLSGFGIETMKIDMDGLTKVATWHDHVQPKAKRLLQEGKVTVLNNFFDYTKGKVIGDTGEYDTEFKREDPASRSITGWHCFLPTAPVTMEDGTRRPISEVKMGDKVITHEGNLKTVTAAWGKPYSGEITKIRLSGMDEEIVATSDHRFMAANRDYRREDLVGRRGHRKTVDGETTGLSPEKGWREIGEVEADEYLSMTPVSSVRGLFVDGIEVDEDLAYLLGWYTAEGFCIKGEKSRIGLSLHWDEWHVAEKLSRICEDKFGTPGTIRKATWPSEDRHWITDFRVSSEKLRLVVETLVGTGSFAKSLDKRMLTLPHVAQKEFMRGWFEGDGSLDDSTGRSSISTVSESLAHQSRQILSRLGEASSLTWNDNNDGDGFVDNHRRIYTIRWNGMSVKANSSRFMKGGSQWHRVVSVEKEQYDGVVYDIEVEGDHSFQAFSVDVHNCECAWNEFAWDRTRQWKKYEGRPCSHVLALYWKSLSTPLDDQEEEQQFDPGQFQGPAEPKTAPEGIEPLPEGAQTTFDPNEPILPEPEPALTPEEAELMGQPRPDLPMSPVEQFAQMQPAVPGSTPAGMPAPPSQSVSVPGAKAPGPANPIQYPGQPGVGGTYSKVIESDSKPFEPGSIVRTVNEVFGVAEGKSEEHGAGQYQEIPAGATGEVMSQDPTLGWVEVIFPLDGGELTPYHVRVFCDPEDLKATRIRPPGPFRTRRP